MIERGSRAGRDHTRQFFTMNSHAREPKPKGFRCPNCSKALYVIDTRQTARGVIVRRRACPDCPYRVTTEERPRATSGGRQQ